MIKGIVMISSIKGVSQHEREYSFPAEVRVAKRQSMQQLALGCAVGGSLCVINHRVWCINTLLYGPPN